MSAHGPKMHPLPSLSRLLAVYRDHVWTVVLYAAGVGLFALATPVAVQALVNTAAFGTVLQPLVALVALLLLGLVCAGVLKALKSWAVEVLQRRMFVDVVERLAYLLPRADGRSAGRVAMQRPVHRFFELFSIHKAASSLLLGGVDAVLASFVGMLVLAFYHPVLLAFDLALIAALFVIVFGLGYNGVRTALDESSAKYELADFLSALESTPYAFRDAGGREYSNQRLDALSTAYLNARARHFRVVVRQLIGALTTQALASAVLLGLGGFLVIERELTLGQLVAAELIVTTVVSALSDLGKHAETYYDLVSGVVKLDHLLDMPTESEADEGGDNEVASGAARLALHDLHLAAEGRRLLDGAELTLEAGARVLLSGPAESGKTSLIELLYGLRRAERGRILLDGTDLRELSRAALRDRIAIVRGAEIVPGSVIDNVRLGRVDITPGKVRALLDEIGLSEELSRLPDGLDTELGAGARLSDSQAFRLTLARALVRAPGLLAIDADLTAIDTASLACVMRAITKPEAAHTLLIVGEIPDAAAYGMRRIRLADGRFHEEEGRS